MIEFETKEELKNAVKALDLCYRGCVKSHDELPQEHNRVGDVYHITDQNEEVMWLGDNHGWANIINVKKDNNKQHQLFFTEDCFHLISRELVHKLAILCMDGTIDRVKSNQCEFTTCITEALREAYDVAMEEYTVIPKPYEQG